MIIGCHRLSLLTLNIHRRMATPKSPECLVALSLVCLSPQKDPWVPTSTASMTALLLWLPRGYGSGRMSRPSRNRQTKKTELAWRMCDTGVLRRRFGIHTAALLTRTALRNNVALMSSAMLRSKGVLKRCVVLRSSGTLMMVTIHQRQPTTHQRTLCQIISLRCNRVCHLCQVLFMKDSRLPLHQRNIHRMSDLVWITPRHQ